MTGEEYIKRKDLHPYWDCSRDPNREDVLDAFEQGKAEGNKELLEKAWNETDLAQWYIASVDGHEPIWTDKHIEELYNDFYLIPKNKVNMEVPEKIYLLHDDRYVNDLSIIWFEAPYATGSIEYTRTDAFIEKACKLLARMIWEVTYEDLEGNSVQHYDKMEFIEDFKKYMEE